jgi:hypothetical protein
MSHTSIATVATGHAGRYLQQLCKHWSHNLDVSFDARQGRVIFPHDARGASWPGDATLLLEVEAESLRCTIEASAEGQLEALQGAVERHLDRFAFREGPLSFDWRAAHD